MPLANEYALPSMDDCDPEQYVICPYDKVHRILAKRYPYHIMKCRKNHRGAKKHFCPFNARHIIPVSELRHHVANCPDRSTIEPDLAYAQTQHGTDGSYLKGDTSVPSYRHDCHPTSSENWDIEESEPRKAHYQDEDPERIHSLVGMTKAQKKEFNRKLLEVHKNSADLNIDDEEPMEPEPPRDDMRRPKQLPRAVAGIEPRQMPQQNGGMLPIRQRVPHGPIGMGRAVLMPGQNSMPRPGTSTTVQGRSIAANIFHSRDTDEESSAADVQETGSRRPVTVAMAAASTAPSAPPSTVSQNEYSNVPLPGRGPNLAGLGRGLGVPRGGYRPGLGMPAVGLNHAPGYPGMQQ
ncbi:uncharacterized protein LOC119724926 [Patiria miniata]|uniref:CHHC U11-48K-type domain-containing protein n=1 Tax=Patiria miniata TaxID=46514 RepID=A0A913ZLG8_PATMI|nr:uncharacterized protein LOC119724926 [Patiria miniata]XP_038052174.1 uncharacterized protein LOC119724926 [Patiria miniata]